MTRVSMLFRALHIFLVVLTMISGTAKVIGIRMDFMRVTHVGFDNWQITAFGAVQIGVALLLAFKRTMNLGAVLYSLMYMYVTFHYIVNDLHPKVPPILLAVLPVILIVYTRRTLKTS